MRLSAEQLKRPLPALGMIALAGLFAAGVYLLLAAQLHGLGFPLDDGWIHQTYARSLARNGRWEYVPGIVSSGSTAPLWTLLLALGYLLRMPPLWWAYGLGWLSLLWLAWSGMQLWRQLRGSDSGLAWWLGVIIVCTWPLVWAALSGMETMLFAAIGLHLIVHYLRVTPQVESRWQPFVQMGFWGGLLILTRPDGVVLLALLAAGLLLGQQRLTPLLWFGGTAVLLLVPYFLFNFNASGSLWPNTFYAKQTEYAAQLAVPFLNRLAQLLYFSLGGTASGWRGITGARWLLLPGLAAAIWQALRADGQARRLALLLPLLWAGGHVVLYAWRLPLVIQHGRYLMAALPIWTVYGLWGWHGLLFRRSQPTRGRWLIQQVGRLTFAGMLVVFFLLGAQAYATDVAFIENEMVQTAHWLAENTAEDAIIASHDIGAIGYFAQRPLLDMAGLITPEIIPLLSDEAAVAAYVLESEADYLVTAPGWPYKTIVAQGNLNPVYTTDYLWTRENGRNNMTIYWLPGS